MVVFKYELFFTLWQAETHICFTFSVLETVLYNNALGLLINLTNLTPFK